MKGKRILCIVLSLAAVCSLMLIRDSAAWLNMHTGSSPTGTICVDKMAFSFDGALGSYLQYPSGSTNSGTYIVTEQNLIVTNGGKITVTNYSTIETEARFKITYDTPSETARVYRAVRNGSDPDTLDVTVDSHWVLNSSDGYFYYYRAAGTPGFAAVGDDDEEEEQGQAQGQGQAQQQEETDPSVNMITKIMYYDELYELDNNGERVTIAQGEYNDLLQKSDYFVGGVPFHGSVHVIFEAKQKDHVDWTALNTWAAR